MTQMAVQATNRMPFMGRPWICLPIPSRLDPGPTSLRLMYREVFPDLGLIRPMFAHRIAPASIDQSGQARCHTARLAIHPIQEPGITCRGVCFTSPKRVAGTLTPPITRPASTKKIGKDARTWQTKPKTGTPATPPLSPFSQCHVRDTSVSHTSKVDPKPSHTYDLPALRPPSDTAEEVPLSTAVSTHELVGLWKGGARAPAVRVRVPQEPQGVGRASSGTLVGTTRLDFAPSRFSNSTGECNNGRHTPCLVSCTNHTACGSVDRMGRRMHYCRVTSPGAPLVTPLPPHAWG